MVGADLEPPQPSQAIEKLPESSPGDQNDLPDQPEPEPTPPSALGKVDSYFLFTLCSAHLFVSIPSLANAIRTQWVATVAGFCKIRFSDIYASVTW